jgi:plasmid stabilization system protein ParE
MAAKLVVMEQARQDMAEARDWCEQDRPGRGARFLARVNECFRAIRQAPRTGRLLSGGYRQKTVSKFPYVAVFRYDAASNTATVAAVFHTSRDPDDLLDRLT